MTAPGIANTPADGSTLFLMWAGASNAGAEVQCFVWADHFEDAFECFTEWLDDNAPGHLCSVSEDDIREAAREHGIALPAQLDWEDPETMRAIEHAEEGLTSIGHTTLEHGTHIPSDQWGGQEYSPASAIDAAALRRLLTRLGEETETALRTHEADQPAGYAASYFLTRLFVEAGAFQFATGADDARDVFEMLARDLDEC